MRAVRAAQLIVCRRDADVVGEASLSNLRVSTIAMKSG